jgi:hypothetical protein
MRLRFRIRALVLLVLFLGLICGVVTLTLENRRLRVALSAARAEAQTSNAQRIYASLVLDMSNAQVWTQLSTSAPVSGANAPMPNGSDVFVGEPPSRRAAPR